MKNSNSCEPRTQPCAKHCSAKTKSWNSRTKRIRTCAKGSNKPSSPLAHGQERVKVLEGLIDSLQERIKTLERQQAKDSHNSSLPPSSDRFVRAPKSLRKRAARSLVGRRGIGGIICGKWRCPIRFSFMQSSAVSTASTICVTQPAARARATSGDRPASQAALGHRTSGGRKAVSRCYHLTRASFPAAVSGSGTVWNEYPDGRYLSGGRPIRALCSRQPTAARAAGSPTLGRQHRQLCQNLSSAVGRGGNPPQSGFGEGERDPPG